MKQILFFATKEDLLPVLAAVEELAPLQYVRMGQCLKPEFEIYRSGSEIPNLGQATAKTASVSASYLVTQKDLSFRVRTIRGEGGVDRHLMDQLSNPDTITFSPGGAWGEDVFLHGRVATVSDTAVSQALMKQFNSRIRKAFRKIGSFWVGPQAATLLDAGKRLTISADSPREFDLTLA